MEEVGSGCCAACGCAQRHAGPLRPHLGVESPDSETDQLIPDLYGPLDAAGRPFCERLRGRVTLLVGLLVRRLAPHAMRRAAACDHHTTPHLTVSVALSRHPPPTRSAWQIFQSVSSFILASYSELLQQHSVIVYFLTMLVGAGGNAGNQAAVLVIRGLATGDVRGWAQYICSEVKMAVAISIVMVAAGFARVTLFHGSYQDAIAIASSLLAIVFISIVVGASLPLLLHRLRLDPAHAGATIQVRLRLCLRLYPHLHLHFHPHLRHHLHLHLHLHLLGHLHLHPTPPLHQVPLTYDDENIVLPVDCEEVATMFAAMKNTDYATKVPFPQP